ncbi:hypothetical protein EW146_g4683 [Bondarzewia mesenterica]|uniref:RING-type domain-containing protein n=1 Tax=Bondarzewia mesenterica TaxID=1095465 RepID=A0A4S4LUA8_9AGAM|nr:hypothetical protein EW146_g4683 [Bondarzewia mesenterica]
MRSRSSFHTKCYRARERNAVGLGFPLDFDTLLTVLRRLTEDDNFQEVDPSSTAAVGQKRPLNSLSSTAYSKRAKLSKAHADDRIPLDAKRVPVFHHQYELQYVKSRPVGCSDWSYFDDGKAKEHNFYKKETELIQFLRERFAGATEPTTIDFGKVELETGHHGANIYKRLESYGYQNSFICFAPPIPHDVDDASGSHLFTWLDDLPYWQPRYCDSLHATMCMVVLPPKAWDNSMERLPFYFLIDVTLIFRLPDIFEPVPPRQGTSRQKSSTRRNTETEARRLLLQFVFPSPSLSPSLSSSFHGKIDTPFFYSCLQPAPQMASQTLEDALQPEALIPSLLPFQKRSVAWMLTREGKSVDTSGAIVDTATQLTDLPLTWERVTVSRNSGEQFFWYYKRATGALSQEVPDPGRTAPGGILAEEPGLGKTLECIALILLNPGIGRIPSNSRWDPEAKVDVKEIKATLIVTPPSLFQQWRDELALHAPSLRVFEYEGWSKLPVPIIEAAVAENLESKGKNSLKASTNKSRSTNKKSKGQAVDSEDGMIVDSEEKTKAETQDWCSYVNTFDVVITTYNVLQHDLNVARPAPVRPRRGVAEYTKAERPRSPLVMVEWYRVIMDEVQMVGGGKTQEMVSLIPRYSSFAVSGTPARAQVSDLSHVLRFLRVDSDIYSPRIWKSLTRPAFAGQFAALFQRYAIRTMKASVKDELTIPQQTRFLVPIELGKVERHVYDQNIEKALLELGLDARGVAATENWEINTNVLRTWLRKLRQICTHPLVGQLAKQGEKSIKPGSLKTIGEVLEAMRDQNWRNVMDDRRMKVNILARSAQLIQRDEAIEARYGKACQILIQAEKEANQLIDDVEVAIADHEAKGEELKKETANLRESRGERIHYDEPGPSSDKGKARIREGSPDSESDSVDADLPRTSAGEEYEIKRRALQQRLREGCVALHRVKFLQGDVYHVMGEPHAPEEDAAYAVAEELRRRLLKVTEQSATRAMAHLARDVGTKGLSKNDLLVPLLYCPRGGIRSYHLMEEADEIIEARLNEQSELLWKWREHMYGLLTQSLAASESEADGQEYSRTLATQGEAETYLQAYSALMADRREVLVAERTALAAHESKEKKLRNTKAAVKAAAALDEGVEIPEDVELQPEHEILRLELAELRKELLATFEGRAVKSIIVELTAVAAKIARDDDPEKVLAREGANALRRLIVAQAIVNDKLEADLSQFRKAFNERIQYFRQLQEISDSVVETDWDGDIEMAIEDNEATGKELDVKINTGRARQRYLGHLLESQDDSDNENEGACILCRCEFTRGYITQCAHVFCEDCMKSWLTQQGGKACPVCRVPVHGGNLERFSIHEKGDDKPAPSLPVRLNGPVPRSRRKFEYNIICSGLFDEIQSMECTGSYGSKIETLVRHLSYLQLVEPGAKSIVFSAWADSLHIIEHALTMNDVPCLRIDQGRGKQNAAKRFRSDPDLLVLLLHGERENAGLNVTSASRVFLLESVVHHSLSINSPFAWYVSIARIDRMGQTRPTEETVEKNILDLAARQGLSLYTEDNSAGTLNVAPFAPDAEKNVLDSPVKKKMQKGDFIFKTDDMLAILFPHLYEETKYLLPASETESREVSPAPPPRTRHVNAVAGPSRSA